MSPNLKSYLTDFDIIKKKSLQKYNQNILIFDTLFESGNLL